MKKFDRSAEEIIAALDSTEQMCGTCRFSDELCAAPSVENKSI